MNQLQSKISIQGALFVILIVLFAILRAQVLLQFNFQYTDSDQTVMWSGLKDYATGIFHEPRFYGQSYNTFLEALLAVPFYKMGMPAFKILPFITSCLAYFPFLFIASILFFRSKKNLSLLVLSLPLILPTEYHLLTSLPRGFVTGIAVASVSFLMLHCNKKWVFFLGGLTAVIGVSVNTNAIILSGFLLALAFIEYRKNAVFYKWCGGGILIGILFHYIIQLFYFTHPTYMLHQHYMFYSFYYIWLGLKMVDEVFEAVVPFFPSTIFLVFALFFWISFHHFKQNKKLKALLIFLIPIAIVMTLGLNKVYDGTTSIFFAYSRMHLYLPVCLAIALTLQKEIDKKFFHFILLLPILTVIFNLNHLDKSIEAQTNNSLDPVITVIRVGDLEELTNHLNELATNHDVELIINHEHAFNDVLTYGSAVLNNDFPLTMRPAYDRRTWLLQEINQKIYARILVIDQSKRLDEIYENVQCLDSTNGAYLFRNKQLQLDEFLKKFEMPLRKID